nr:hypothetical protein T459_31975 [Ipomoea batatas]
MEPNLAVREDNLAFDYLFDKFSKDIDEFQKTTTGIQGTNDPANHEDFIDTFFSFIHSKHNNANDPSHSGSITNLILQDFEEFETAELPPCQADASEAQREEETQEMLDELRQETWEFGIADDNNMCPTQSYNDFWCNVGSGDLTFPPFGCGPVVRYFFCGQTNKNTPRKRIKRKYRGVKLSEEEAARKREENKIKNRETAAKAHKMKLFLEFHERINIPPKPLKRTISALV